MPRWECPNCKRADFPVASLLAQHLLSCAPGCIDDFDDPQVQRWVERLAEGGNAR